MERIADVNSYHHLAKRAELRIVKQVGYKPHTTKGIRLFCQLTDIVVGARTIWFVLYFYLAIFYERLMFFNQLFAHCV
jgi:hypothetical protein